MTWLYSTLKRQSLGKGSQRRVIRFSFHILWSVPFFHRAERNKLDMCMRHIDTDNPFTDVFCAEYFP